MVATTTLISIYTLSLCLGTNGGVSLPGLLFSAMGGTVVGVAYYTTLLICSSIYQLEASPPQWPIIIIATIAGIV